MALRKELNSKRARGVFRNPHGGYYHMVQYTPGTPSGVSWALESARITGRRVRVFYGDPVTGEDWSISENVRGIIDIARDDSNRIVPVLRQSRKAKVGEELKTDCIVRVIHLDGAGEVYRHPQYHTPELGVDMDKEAGRFFVTANGQRIGEPDGFETRTEVANRIKFLLGHRVAA